MAESRLICKKHDTPLNFFMLGGTYVVPPILIHLFVVPARISSQSSRHCWRSPLPHASALIQRDFGCVLGVQQTKQLPHVAKVDLVWQLGV
ncbi:hypothetical protein TNCV_2600321 [Trichonephila clavipes]|nr:hypothetical protein TNCV_2600321 [Trichonephila clavipes]